MKGSAPEDLSPEDVFDRVVGVMVRLAPQLDLDPEDVRDWARRHRDASVPMIAAALASRQGPRLIADPPDEWTAARRTKANLAAMAQLAELVTNKVVARGATHEQREALASYSGWGGLSIKKVEASFPKGLPIPDAAGLIHEYYTPSKLCAAVATLVLDRLDTLPAAKGTIRSLEPSAGIGRFLRFLENPRLTWAAAELSPLSALFLRYLFPNVLLRPGSFEAWAEENASAQAGQLGLVVANPPYGKRGAERVEDSDPEYRGHRNAIYHYFMRRAQDMLARGGLGVWLVPMGFMHSRGGPTAELRRQMLLRHHVAAAFRLPSTLFPGANIVTDLILMRARGGELAKVLAADEYIAEGGYFEAHPSHVLGELVGDDPEGGKVGRRHLRVLGDFDGFPAFAERPLDDSHTLKPLKRPKAAGLAASVVQDFGTTTTTGLKPPVAAAVGLGERVNQYLADVGTNQAERARGSHGELTEALRAWVTKWGDPLANVELAKAAKKRPILLRFLAAFSHGGNLAPAVAQPPQITSRWEGQANDVLGQAQAFYRDHRRLDLDAFVAFHRSLGGRSNKTTTRDYLISQGWCIPYERSTGLLVPPEDYLTGYLWPRYDAALTASGEKGFEGKLAKQQADRILDTIAPLMFEDIDNVDPRMGWVPLELVAEWLGSHNARNQLMTRVDLIRRDGLIQIEQIPYTDLSIKASFTAWGYPKHADRPDAVPRWMVEAIGWLNHDYSLWRPRKTREENINVKRTEWEAEALLHFSAWAGATDERRTKIAHAYNRSLRGFKAREYLPEPLALSRWHYGPRTTPHPWQLVGARRVDEQRGGLVAFDVGVGKTLTGLLVLAKARQDGWARRPVILVPRSLLWKWEADVRTALPDYRTVVIGSSRKKKRDGTETTGTDNVQVQASKWTDFQAGLYDVAICSYQSFGRIRVKAASLKAYASKQENILREVKLAQDRYKEQQEKGKKELTERQLAVLKHGVEGWLAEKLEPPKGQAYLPGITWEDVGVDLLIVDELQNYKNLYMPQPRGSAGVPKFMGSGGEGSKRAWALDFRAALVRRRNGGAGVVGLSATPAKNSPLEFYNVLQYIDEDAWRRIGIPDPETFIDRFVKIDMQYVIQPDGTVEQKAAAVAFRNLNEIRDVLDRYADFQTAESVSERYPDRKLVLPEPESKPVYVEMHERQARVYDELRRKANEIRNEMRGGGPGARALAGALLGIMAQMGLVSLHPSLVRGGDLPGWTWRTAKELPERDQNTAKFAAVSERIKKQPGCGHIIFLENVAAQWWLRDVLVRSGAAKKGRIAVLNASAVPDAGRRVTIAREFNGDEFNPAKYDVVIANSVAYEGIDLQRRTCAIHHCDLPWEPATIQQRNGRGVRQGNTREVIGIYYYLAKGSFDAIRFQMIAKKRGWLTTLITSQDRVTNNPGAQAEMSGSEIAALLASDPQEAEKLLGEAKAQIQAERRKQGIAAANDALMRANARLRRAERRSTDPTEAKRLRAEAKLHLDKVASADPEVWPWAAHAAKVLELQPFISRAKVGYAAPPLFPGDRMLIRTGAGEQFYEVGQLAKGAPTVWIRRWGTTTGGNIGLDGKEGWPPAGAILPSDLNPASYDVEGDRKKLVDELITSMLWGSAFDPSELWKMATGTADHVWERTWRDWQKKALRSLPTRYGSPRTWPPFPLFPRMLDGRLDLVTPDSLDPEKGALMAPTETGWQEFLTGSVGLAQRWTPSRGLGPGATAYTDLNRCARDWFGRPFPTGYLPKDDA